MIVKVRYVGKSFGIDGLTDGKIYDVLEVDADTGALRVVDDSDEDYLYSPTNPRPLSGDSPGGKFEVVEDDASGSLQKVING